MKAHFTARADKSNIDKLKEIAKREKRSFSQLIDFAIEEYVKRLLKQRK